MTPEQYADKLKLLLDTDYVGVITSTQIKMDVSTLQLLVETLLQHQTTGGSMTPEQQGQKHGTEYAHHHWQTDPAEYQHALAWCLTAAAGTLHDTYELPEDAADAIDPELNTEGWCWQELADYQGAWETAYYDTTTELCRNVIHKATA